MSKAIDKNYLVSSLKSFESDVIAKKYTKQSGITIGGIQGNENIGQLSFLNLNANDTKYLNLNSETIFDKFIIQAYKFIPGESNIVETLKQFNNVDNSNFNYRDGIVEFTDKGMGIKDTYELNRTKYNDELYITEAFNKDDFVDIKSII